MTPILYSFRRCPYAMRARMALASAQIFCEIREVVLREKPSHMLEISPKGTVPVLLLPSGEVIEESLEIMRWALGENDPQGWTAPDKAHRETLIAHNDGPFKHHLDRFKYTTRYQGEDKEHHRAKTLETLESTNTRLENHGGYLQGKQPSMADFAIAPFVRQLAFADKTWFDALPLPHLHAWLAWFLESPEFTSVMHKYPPWKEGDEPTTFPQADPL